MLSCSVSRLSKVGEMSAMRARIADTSLYGSAAPDTSLSARNMAQSSRALLTSGAAGRVRCTRPSVLTYVPDFSVLAHPGSTTSARLAPASPWLPWYTTNEPSGTCSAVASSAPSRYTNEGGACSAAPGPFTKPRSSAATRAALACSTFSPL